MEVLPELLNYTHISLDSSNYVIGKKTIQVQSFFRIQVQIFNNSHDRSFYDLHITFCHLPVKQVPDPTIYCIQQVLTGQGNGTVVKVFLETSISSFSGSLYCAIQLFQSRLYSVYISVGTGPDPTIICHSIQYSLKMADIGSFDIGKETAFSINDQAIGLCSRCNRCEVAGK